MVNVLPRLNSMFSLVGKACAVLLLAGASMLAGSGRAQAQHYVTIQPIVICQTPLGGKVTTTTTPGRGCAPINCLGNTSGSPDCQATLVGSLGSPTNPIGFFDTTSKDDVTWAIWNQLGITVAWVLPVLYYNNSKFQSITDITVYHPERGTNSSCTTPYVLQSTQLKTLTQQNGISNGTAACRPAKQQLSRHRHVFRQQSHPAIEPAGDAVCCQLARPQRDIYAAPTFSSSSGGNGRYP